MTSEPRPASGDEVVTALASTAREERQNSLRALHLLEYALAAPAPRRHRTWVHRVTHAVDTLARVLADQAQTHEMSIGLLTEIALSHPTHAPQIQQLRYDLLDLAIATASVREQIEADDTFGINAADIRNRIADLTRRIRAHQARETDLIFDTTGLMIDNDPEAP